MKMKIERGADTFYDKEVDEFTEKRQRTELIYKQILIIHYLLILSFSLITNNGRYRHQSLVGWGNQVQWRGVLVLKWGLLVAVYFLKLELV